jgi:hypothetical protein
MSVIPSTSMPTSMELAAPARTSETTDAGTEVMIQEGTIDGSKPNSAPGQVFDQVQQRQFG